MRRGVCEGPLEPADADASTPRAILLLTTGALQVQRRTRGRMWHTPCDKSPHRGPRAHGNRRQRPIRYCPSTGGQDARARTRRGPGGLLPNNRDEDEDRSAKKKFPLGASAQPRHTGKGEFARASGTTKSGCNRWGLRGNVHAHTRGGKGGIRWRKSWGLPTVVDFGGWG